MVSDIWSRPDIQQGDRPPPSNGDASKPPRMQTSTAGSVPPVLDRSMSHRAPPTQPPPKKPLDRSVSTRNPEPKVAAGGHGLYKSQSQSGRARAPPGPPVPGSAAAALSRQATKGQQQSSGAATPRRRDKQKENQDVVARLQAICTDADPTKLYRNLVKIGQGLVHDARLLLTDVALPAECILLINWGPMFRSPSSR